MASFEDVLVERKTGWGSPKSGLWPTKGRREAHLKKGRRLAGWI